MNKARAMLDALMGPGRDEGNSDPTKTYKDKSVCKGFLLGFCPFDKTVLGGKRNFEVCKKIHSEIMQSQFLADPNSESYRKDCEIVSLRDLEQVVLDREGHIATERGRIREDYKRRKAPLPPDVNIKISAMKREALSMLERAEGLDDDKTREKEQLTKQSAELKQETEDYLKEETRKAAEKVMQEELCEVCGTAYMGKDDKETHFKYRVHTGYEQVIARLAELKEKKAEIDNKREAERKEKRKKDWEKAQAKEKEREGKGDNEEKSEAGDKDRDDDRDRKDKGGEGASDKRGRRDRSRSRSRDKRDRSRSRDKRDRSRDRRDRSRDKRDGSRDKRDRRERSRSRDRARRSRR